MSLRENVKSLFTTPLAQFIVPNSAGINPGLAKILFDLEQRSGAHLSPPLEGWHSDDSLADAVHPEVGDLMDTARSAVFSVLGIVTRSTGFEAQQHLRAWSSIYRPRTFSRPDVHSGNSWSGIYCVQAAELGAERSKLAGRISFHDPRNRLTMADQPGPEYKSTFEVRPRDGMMLIFPSWLQYHLNPFVSDSAILLICFESRITGLSQRN